MSDRPKKRPLFQFHLSTAVVLMFVAGGLMWANIRHDEAPIRYGWPKPAYVLEGWVILRHPVIFQTGDRSSDTSTDPVATGVRVPGATDATPPPAPFPSTYAVIWSGIAIDAATALVTLVSCACLCEYLIRRKERRP